jgi:hypothetical protein
VSAGELLELLKAKERSKAPLIVYHSPLLPHTPDEAIDAALRAGRPLVHVCFVRSDGDGHPAVRGS